jgi:hypothetical protein
MNNECLLYDRQCTDCGQCDICDLDSNKICDDCCKCLDDYRDSKVEEDYHTIEIDEIITDEE